MRTKIIYALECPTTGRTYYVGQSEVGLERAYSHINSKNPEMRKWMDSINNSPVVKILEKDCDDLCRKEGFWIREMIKRKEPLLNKMIPTEKQLMFSNLHIDEFIRMKRKEAGLTQMELAKKTGIGLRLMREIEQGKQTCRIDGIMKVLSMFGATLVPIVEVV